MMRPSPWFVLDGLNSWSDEEGFSTENRNFLVDEIGRVDALLRKRLLVPRSRIIWEDSHCNRKTYENGTCDEKTRADVEIITSLPRTLVFYIGQRSGSSYNSSSEIIFPSTLRTSDSVTTLEYTLIGKVLSTTSTGTHFTAKVIREFEGKSSLYTYDDLKANGMSLWSSSNPNDLSRKEDLTVMGIYTLSSSDEAYTSYSREKAGKYNNYL